MSYTSTNTLLESTVLGRVFEIIEWLGYKKHLPDPSISDQVGNYIWTGDRDSQSFVGVELQVYQKSGIITIDTRTRSGRSYWDLELQNKTIKTLYDLFGGSFVTDSGDNTLFPKDEDEPTQLEAGLYSQKWKHYNSVSKLSLLIETYENKWEFKPTGLSFFDEINPKILFNNLQIPYLVGVFEEYLKSTFVVLFEYSPEKDRKRIFKKLLSQYGIQPDYLESLPQNSESIEWHLTRFMSFQNPRKIVESFNLIDKNIGVSNVLKKLTSDKTQSLFERIDKIVKIRHEIVHHGRTDVTVTDDVIKQFVDDLNEVVDLIYRRLSDHYNLGYRQDEYYFRQES